MSVSPWISARARPRSKCVRLHWPSTSKNTSGSVSTSPSTRSKAPGKSAIDFQHIQTRHNFKIYRDKINEHEAYGEEKLRKVFKLAREKSPRVYALISLLYAGALRIQDVVGLTFGSVTQLKADEDGCVKLHIRAKKSTARSVMLDRETVDAVKAYQDSIGATDSKIMFPAGGGRIEANKWTKVLTKFYKPHGLTVKSHDFRTTSATEYYKATQDIVATSQFLGHKKVVTT